MITELTYAAYRCTHDELLPEHALAQLPNSGRISPSDHDVLAGVFARVNRPVLRYVAAWRCWMVWDGVRWRRDDAGNALHLARELCRIAAEHRDEQTKAGKKKGRSRAGLGVAGLFTAIERLARADPDLAAAPDLWDADRFLLNTPDGIIDTRTGELSPHRADAWITRMTMVHAAPDAPRPVWQGFLRRITAGDEALQSFLQRIAGYALTGHTGEHALFFAYGTGANGKSTFITTLMRVMGDYAAAAPMESFTAGAGSRLVGQLAERGTARLITAQETEHGRHWAEARIKALTGGDAIATWGKRREGTSFTPRFKLLFAGNRLPSLSGVDEAIRRRFHLLPFAVTIPEDQRDPSLLDRLVPEYPAILGWALQGAIAWYHVGLAPPDSVVAATRQYLETEDSCGLWLDDCADAHRRAWTSSADLYTCWKNWAQARGEPAGSQKRLGRLLQARGFAPKRLSGGRRGFSGLRLRENSASDASQRVTDTTTSPVTSPCARLPIPRYDASSSGDGSNPA